MKQKHHGSSLMSSSCFFSDQGVKSRKKVLRGMLYWGMARCSVLMRLQHRRGCETWPIEQPIISSFSFTDHTAKLYTFTSFGQSFLGCLIFGSLSATLRCSFTFSRIFRCRHSRMLRGDYSRALPHATLPCSLSIPLLRFSKNSANTLGDCSCRPLRGRLSSHCEPRLSLTINFWLTEALQIWLRQCQSPLILGLSLPLASSSLLLCLPKRMRLSPTLFLSLIYQPLILSKGRRSQPPSGRLLKWGGLNPHLTI